MMILFTHVISLVLGVIASYIAWWWLNHRWIPAISFSQEICKYLIDDNNIYVSAFKNVGQRKIIDVEVISTIGIKNFKLSKGWQYFSVKTSSSRLPVLDIKKRALIRIFDQRDVMRYINYPSWGLRKEIEKCVSLEEVLSIGEKSMVKVDVFGYDSFSGARKHYSSCEYTNRNIRSGRFEDLNVVKDDDSVT